MLPFNVLLFEPQVSRLCFHSCSNANQFSCDCTVLPPGQLAPARGHRLQKPFGGERIPFCVCPAPVHRDPWILYEPSGHLTQSSPCGLPSMRVNAYPRGQLITLTSLRLPSVFVSFFQSLSGCFGTKDPVEQSPPSGHGWHSGFDVSGVNVR